MNPPCFCAWLSGRLQQKVEDYIKVFEPYRETYKANNEHMTKVKEAYTNSSLEEFHNDVDKFKGMTEDFEAIPACATVRFARAKGNKMPRVTATSRRFPRPLSELTLRAP